MIKKEHSAKYLGLSIHQEKFIDYYMETGDRIKSVLLAGYTTKYPHVRATYLLTQCKGVIKEIQRQVDEQMTYYEVKESELVKNMMFLAFNEGTPHKDRIKATEVLMKYKDMLTDNIHHSGSMVDTPVNVTVILESEDEPTDD